MAHISLRHKFDALFIVLGILLFFGSIFPTNNRPATAEASHNVNQVGAVSGFAWSDTVGWISLSHTNCDANGDGISDGTPEGCPPAGTPMTAYNLSISFPEIGGNKDMTGYGWSSNIGWIDFDPAGPYPAGGSAIDHAKLDTSYPTSMYITGWARACSVFLSGCSGPLKPEEERGGWDGWISMSGTAGDGSQYGVRLNSATMTGFEGAAWGSDILGWVDFHPAGFTPVAVVSKLTATCTYEPEQANVDITDVTWTATVLGGRTPYSYSWTLTNNPPYQPGSSGITNPTVVRYGEISQGNTGSVRVTSDDGQEISPSCTNTAGSSSAGVSVIGVPDYSISPNPVTVSMEPIFPPPVQKSGSAQVFVIPINGFATPVNFEALTFSPSAQVNCATAYNPPSVPVNGSTNLTVTCTVSNPFVRFNPGTYTSSNAIKATSNGITRFSDLRLEVTGSPPPPIASCTYSPDTADLGADVTWESTVTGGKSPYTYSWIFDEQNPVGAPPTVIKQYSTVGLKTGHVTITDSLGRNSGADCVSQSSGTGSGVQVGTNPTITNCTFTPATQVINQNVTWEAFGMAGGNGEYAYDWTLPGTPAPAEPANPQVVQYNTAGTYGGAVVVSSAGASTELFICSASGNPADTTLEITEPPAEFGLNAAPSALSITTTGAFPTPSKSAVISISNPIGLSGDVTLSAALPPALQGKAIVSFTPDNTISAPYTSSSTFTISLTEAVENGSHAITITGANAGTDPDPTVNITLTVNQFSPTFIEQ